MPDVDQADAVAQASRARGAGARLAWVLTAVAGVVIVVFAVLQLRSSGTDAGALQRAFGFTIGSFTAAAERGSDPAPALEGPRLGGGTLSLDDYEGKVVVVNLWASWCGPCRREQPDLERVWRAYRERGVQFLGLNVRDQEAAARAYQVEFDVTYPSFFDTSSRLAAALKAQVLPTTYVIDRAGRIAFHLAGTVDEVLLREVLDSLLTPAPQGSP